MHMNTSTQTHTHTRVRTLTHLVELVRTLPAQVVLAGQDDDGLLEQLHADGADQLLLQRGQVGRGLHLLASVTQEAYKE